MAKLDRKMLAKYLAEKLLKGAISRKDINSVAATLVRERRSREVSALMRDTEVALARLGRTQVNITSARPVSDGVKHRLARLLSADKPLFHDEIDPACIGGVKAETLDAQVDLTVQRKLHQLKAFKG